MRRRRHTADLRIPDRRRLALPWLLASALLSAATATSSAATWQEIMRAGEQSRDWLNYGGDPGQMRYVPSAAINVGNVERLRLKWIHQSGFMGPFQNTPIVEHGVMYVTSPYNHVFAIDAGSGRELWHYAHELGANLFCCGPNSRGVAIAGDALFMGTLDGLLISLDKRTGAVNWTVEVADPETGHSLTHAPAIYKNSVIVGVSGGAFGIRGFVSAYGQERGELIWRRYTIAAPEEVGPDGLKGWEGGYQERADGIDDLHRDIAQEKAAAASGRFSQAWRRGGAAVWSTPSVDAERGFVAVTTGNPWPMLDGSVRPGDNRWANSLLVLSVETGELRCAYQYVPHDIWNLDAASAPILADVEVADGRSIPAVVHGGKTGWVYLHDRRDCRLVWRSAPTVPQENLFAPLSPDGARVAPGGLGGIGWSPGAVSRRNGLVYYLGIHLPVRFTPSAVPHEATEPESGLGFDIVPDERRWGYITALSLRDGKIRWQVTTEQPMVGGVLVTAGDVLFAGEGSGLFSAYNALTGERLWHFRAGAGVNSAPMAFEVDGKLHIAVAAGGNLLLGFRQGDTILVFALEEDDARPSGP